jgi:hypothetical protein
MIGTKENPVRCSALPMLLTCPGFYAMRNLYEGTSGVAADMGTAVGRGAELFHHGESPDVAVGVALGESEGRLVGADATLVDEIIREYCQDPRNGPLGSMQVLPESQELELKFEYQGIHFSGHMDQVRRHEDGKLYVWDLKNGKMYGGGQMVDAYAAQLAMYAIGASMHLGETVSYGGIIRTRGYIGKANSKLYVGDRPVFFHANWPEGTAEYLADKVVKVIKRLADNDIDLAPGSQCGFCPGGGIGSCSTILNEAYK